MTVAAVVSAMALAAPTRSYATPPEAARTTVAPDPSAQSADLSLRYRVRVDGLAEEKAGTLLAHWPSLRLVGVGAPVFLSVGSGGLAMLGASAAFFSVVDTLDTSAFPSDTRRELRALTSIEEPHPLRLSLAESEAGVYSAHARDLQASSSSPQIIAFEVDLPDGAEETFMDLAVEASGEWEPGDLLLVHRGYSTFLACPVAEGIEAGIRRIPLTMTADKPIYLVSSTKARLNSVQIHLFKSDRNDDWCADSGSIWWAGDNSTPSTPNPMPFSIPLTVWETIGYGAWTHVEVYEDDPLNDDEIYDDFVHCTVAAWGGWYGQVIFNNLDEGDVGDYESDCLWEIDAHCWCGNFCDGHDVLYLEDVRGPAVPCLVSPPNNACTSDNTPTLEACSVVDAGGSPSDVDYEFQVEGYSIVSSGDPVESYPSLPDGLHNWHARSVDDCGNRSAWSSWRSLRIDTADPTISEAYWGTSGSCSAGHASRYYNCQTAYLIVHGSNFADCPSTITATVSECLKSGLGERYSAQLTRQSSTCYVGSFSMPYEDDWIGTPEFSFSIMITDPCGNSDSASSSCIDHEDNVAPSGPTLTSPSQGADRCPGVVGFSWTGGTDSCSGLDDQPFRLRISRNADLSSSTVVCDWTSSYACQHDFDPDDDGRWYWGVEIRDVAGNTVVNSIRYFDIIEPATVADARWTLANSCDGAEADESSNCQRLYLTVRGQGFSDCPSSISANIWEDDLPGYRYAATLSRVSDSCYLGYWDPVWEDDGLFGSPEYQFTVAFEDACGNDLEGRSGTIGVEDLAPPEEAATLLQPGNNSSFCIGQVDFAWIGGADACSGLADEPYKLVRSRNADLSDAETLHGWTAETGYMASFGENETGDWYWSVVVRDGRDRETTALPCHLTIIEGTSIANVRWTLTGDCQAPELEEVDGCFPVHLVVQGVGFLNAPDQITASIWEDDPLAPRATTTLHRESDQCYIGEWTPVWEDDWWFDPEYRFEVQFTDNCGSAHEEQSELLSLEDHTAPTPVALNGMGEVSPGHVAFSWEATTDDCIGLAEAPYHVLAGRESTLLDPLFDSGWIVGTSSSSYIAPELHGAWYWRVDARDLKGNESSSAVGTFQIDNEVGPGRIPCPILFVHGITGSFRSWYEGKDGRDYYDESILYALEHEIGLVFGQTIHVTCDKNLNHEQLFDSKETDVYVFGDTYVAPGDFYLVNFDVDRNGPVGGRCAVADDAEAKLLKDCYEWENDLYVTASSKFRQGDVIRVGDEYMIVEGVGWDFVNVSRSQFGSDAPILHGNLSEIFIVSNQSNQASIAKEAYGLALAIQKVKAANGAEKVILVGHSMGGLVARLCAEREAQGSVAKVVTIDSPNLGSIKGEYADVIDEAGEYFGGLDLRSAGVRDVAYHYDIGSCSEPDAPGVPADSDNGVFLFGGSETDPELASLGFVDLDIDANGYVGDAIIGLNEAPMGAGADYEFAQIVGESEDWSAVGECKPWDLIIQTERQQFNAPGVNRVRYVHNVVHSWALSDYWLVNDPAVLGAIADLMWGLDEPNTRSLAYPLRPNVAWTATITPDAGAVVDPDWFLAFRQEHRVRIYLADLGAAVGTFYWLGEQDEEHSTAIVPEAGEWTWDSAGQDIHAGELRFGIELEGDSGAWRSPYTVWWEPFTPVALTYFTLTYDTGTVVAQWRFSEGGVPTSQRLTGQSGDLEWSLDIESAGDGGFTATDESDFLSAGGDLVYRLEGREGDGDWMLLRRSSITIPMAALRTALVGAYPNPFNPDIVVEFSLAEQSAAHVVVVDMAGRLVRVLNSDVMQAGSHRVIWDGRTDGGESSASGVYFIELRTPGHRDAVKVVLLQ